jgi:dephospho-CoA kinase
MFRDWLRADPSERASYACMKTDLAAKAGSIEHYVNGKEPWFDAADQRARTWAESTAWVPPIGRA